MKDAKQEYTEHLDRYTVDGQGIPQHLKHGLLMYFVKGVRPGTFLERVLRNDLRGAVFHADSASLAALRMLTCFVDLYAPQDSAGGLDKVEKWIRSGGIEGRERNDRADLA